MKNQRKRPAAALWIISAAVLLTVFLLLDSKYSLCVTEYSVASERIPAGFGGFKIVQLSDLHGAKFGRDNARLAELVAAQEPDIIVLTGDLITDAGDIPAAVELAKKLTKLCGVYFVSGNHDFGSGAIDKLAAALDEAGVKYLRNECITLERNGDGIVLCGVEDPNSWSDMVQPDELVQSVRTEHPDSFIVLLGHRNYWAEKYPDLPVGLILCGHIHGGIVRLPGVGGVLNTDRTLFPEYDAGLFRSGSYSMIVSRGLGNSVCVPRFLNRPEIVSVTLCSGR